MGKPFVQKEHPARKKVPQGEGSELWLCVAVALGLVLQHSLGGDAGSFPLVRRPVLSHERLCLSLVGSVVEEMQQRCWDSSCSAGRVTLCASLWI